MLISVSLVSKITYRMKNIVKAEMAIYSHQSVAEKMKKNLLFYYLEGEKMHTKNLL